MGLLRTLIGLVVVVVGVVRAHGQCSVSWSEENAFGGVNGEIYAVAVWDHDGAGPDGAQLVVGGSFQLAGAAAVSNVARWDGEVWHAIGAGVPFEVRAMAAHPDGRLIVAGRDSQSGNMVGRVAACSGGVWSLLGTGVEAAHRAMVVTPSGDILVAGDLSEVSGRAQVRRWTGSAWQPLGGGFDGAVESLAVLPGGGVLAGGEFMGVGSTPARGVAAWDGSEWRALGSGLLADGPPHVYAIAPMADGSVVAAGRFTSAGGVPARNVARWDGAAWSALGAGIDGSVRAVLEVSPGRVAALGYFGSAGGVAASNAAVWDGAAWGPMGGGLRFGGTSAAVLPDGRVASTGGVIASPRPESPLSIWDGQHWTATREHTLGGISAFAVAVDGTLYASGYGAIYGPVSPVEAVSLGDVGGIYRRVGSAWEPVGVGGSRATAMCFLPGGDLIVAHTSPTTIGGVAVNYLSRWDGTAWSDFGTGINGVVWALCVAPNGQLLIGGSFTQAGGVTVNGIAWWDGSTATAIGSGFAQDTVNSIAVLTDGTVVAGTNNAVYERRGNAWVRPSAGYPEFTGRVQSIVPDEVGGYWVGGANFRQYAYLDNQWMVWSRGTLAYVVNGSYSVTGLQDRLVFSLLRLRNGNLLAVHDGLYEGVSSSPRVVMYRPWSGPPQDLGLDYRAGAAAELPDGRIVLGGDFSSVGNVVSARFAEGTVTNVPVFTQQPLPVSMTPCGVAQLSAETAGGTVTEYRWMQGTALLPNSAWAQNTNGRILTLNRPPLSVSGMESRLRVTTTCGVYYSEAARVTVWSPADFNRDGDFGTDQDIEAFFACLGGSCCSGCGSADVNGNGSITDQDIEAFFRVMGGGAC